MWKALCLAALGLVLFSAPVPAVVDQECTPEIWGTYSIRLGTPIGQEFIPAATSLNFVDFFVINNPSSLDDTARVFAIIRADSLGGPELGTSSQVHIPKPYETEVRLSFPNPVLLEPGRTYLIEARAVGPGNPLLAMGDQAGSCPGIRGYFQGQPLGNGGDFWFRTGLDLTPTVPSTWGLLKTRYR